MFKRQVINCVDIVVGTVFGVLIFYGAAAILHQAFGLALPFMGVAP